MSGQFSDIFAFANVQICERRLLRHLTRNRDMRNRYTILKRILLCRKSWNQNWNRPGIFDTIGARAGGQLIQISDGMFGWYVLVGQLLASMKVPLLSVPSSGKCHRSTSKSNECRKVGKINSVYNRVAFNLCWIEWRNIFTLPSIRNDYTWLLKNKNNRYCAHTGWPRNSKPYWIINMSYLIVLTLANGFVNLRCQTSNTILQFGIKYSMYDLISSRQDVR